MNGRTPTSADISAPFIKQRHAADRASQMVRALLQDRSIKAVAPYLYLVFALPSFFVLIFSFPNFQAPDDPDHFKRAYTLLERPFDIVTPHRANSGAMIDTGLKQYAYSQLMIASRPDRPYATDEVGANKDVDARWTGVVQYDDMPGAIAYFPLLYAPQTIAIAAGRSLGLTVAETVFLARVVNGTLAIALTWLALVLLPQGHALILIVLALPRTMLQYASNSADPLLFALTLLILALSLRPGIHRAVSASVLSAALFVAASVRPPLAGLALLPMSQGLLQRRYLIFRLSTLAVLLAAMWMLWVVPQIADNRCPGEAGNFAAKTATFAVHLPTILYQTFSQNAGYYFYSLVAHYGFGDGPRGLIPSPMQSPIYSIAILLLAWAIRIDVAESSSLSKATKILLSLSAIAIILVTLLAMYIACTPTGSEVIAGAQGRYFIPAVFALAPVIAGSSRKSRAWPCQPFVACLVFYVITSTVLMVSAVPDLYRL